MTLSSPAACIVDRSYNVYVGQLSNVFVLSYPAMTSASNVIGGMTTGTMVDGSGSSVVFNQLVAMAWVDSAQSLIFVSDYTNAFVRQFTVSTPTTTAWKFSVFQPKGLVADSTFTYLYLATGTSAIYKILISAKTGVLLGLTSSSSAYTDSALATASYNHPRGVTMDYSGNLYVVDQFNYVIRQITATNAYTLAGTGATGTADGSASTSTFVFPSGIVYVGSNTWYISDNQYIRCIGSCKLCTVLLFARCLLVLQAQFRHHRDRLVNLPIDHLANLVANLVASHQANLVENPVGDHQVNLLVSLRLFPHHSLLVVPAANQLKYHQDSQVANLQAIQLANQLVSL